MIDVGLIGFGFAGRTFHAPFIEAVEGLRLAAILQRQGDEAARAYPSARIVRSLDELFNLESIRVVVVATPNPSHFDLARQALERGKDVVVDKPFTTTYDEASDLAKLAKSRKLILSVYQNRRWDGDFTALQKLVDSQELGRLVLFESHYDRYRPQLRPGAWRERDDPGSGVFFDLGVHLIDQAMLVFGTPSAICADIRIERDHARVDDAFDVTLFYGGMRAVMRGGMLAKLPGPRFLLHGTEGSFVKYGMDPQEEALRRGDKPGGEHWGVEDQKKWGTVHFGDDSVRRIPSGVGDYRKFYENVRDAMKGQASLAVTAEQALNLMWALNLARESSATGCKVAWREPGTSNKSGRVNGPQKPARSR